jgi:hypothetical protein
LNLAGLERDIRRLQERQGAADPEAAAILRDAALDPVYAAALETHRELVDRLYADPKAATEEEKDVLADLLELFHDTCWRLAQARNVDVDKVWTEENRKYGEAR